MTEDQNKNDTTQQDDVEGHGFGGKGGKRESADRLLGEKGLVVYRDEEKDEEEDVEGHSLKF